MARNDSDGLHKHFRVSDDWWNITEDDKRNPPSRGLFIGNIPNGTKGSSIREIFAAYGKIETSSPAGFGQVDRGFALLTYQDIDSAQRAISRCYGQDLFNHGEGCSIRFSNSQQQSKTAAPGVPSSKVSEARSEWFQQSKYSPGALERARKIENEDVLPRTEPTPRLPPSAPRKMVQFAKKVLTSPSAPRTTRVDISPPPLRRHDTYRPDPATLREEKRRSSHDPRPKDIDRYVPSYRVRDEAYCSRRENESFSPPRRGRSPGWSSSYSQAFEARFSGSEDRRSSSIQISAQNRSFGVAQACDVLDRSEKIVQPGASQSATASATVASSSPENPSANEGGQKEAVAANAAQLKETSRPPQLAQIPAPEDLPVHVVAPPVTNGLVNNLPSMPTITKAQDDLAPSASTSPTWHRLRPPTDDTSSITSSSTKSSQRKRQCAYCKAPDGVLLGTLVKCNACSRRYHGSCGTPRPDFIKEHEVFICGRCRKKSRSSMSEQQRATSPELGTPNNDIVVPDASLSKQIEDSGHPKIAVQLSTSNEVLPGERISTSLLDKSAADSRTQADVTCRPPTRAVPRSSSIPPFTVPELLNANHSRQIVAEGTLPSPSIEPPNVHERSANAVLKTVPASSYRKPYVTTEVEEDDGSVTGEFLPASPMTSSKVVGISLTDPDSQQDHKVQQETIEATASGERRRQDMISPPSTGSSLEGYNALSMPPTRIQKQAMEMVQRYKNVTCDLWKLSHCRFDFCMFAHRDTGIYMPDWRSYNPHWTCYAWIRGLVCPYGDRCRFAHQDTGLYVGVDGRCSKKHVTCTYWHNGRCRHPEESCLFAHEDTGISADGRVTKHVMEAVSAATHLRSNSSIVNPGPLVNTSPREPYHTLPAALTPSPESQVPAPSVSIPGCRSTATQEGMGASRASVLDERPTVEQDGVQIQPANPGISVNLTYDQALWFLGAKDDFVGDHQLTALFRAKIRDDESLKPEATEAIRVIAKHRKSALLQNWIDPGSAKDQPISDNTSTLESSPYSPRSAIEDSMPLHRLDAPFSLTSNIAPRDQDLVYGLDTPYSPTFTMATTEQSSPKGDIGESNSKAASVSNSIHSEASPRLRSSFSLVPAITAPNAESLLSSVTRTLVPPQRTQEQNEAFDGVESATKARPQSLHDEVNKPLSNGVTGSTLQSTNGSSRLDTQDLDLKAAVKAVTASAVPSKHYAKRSTVDPRTLRRNMLASAAAKSASPVEASVSSIASIKKCEKCDKRIFGSVSFCTSCSKDSTSALTSREGDPERISTGSPRDHGELRTGSSNDIHASIAKFMEANAARSVLAVAKKHAVNSAPDPMSAKSLKRPHEDAVFIQRKRPKVMVPLRKSSTTKREGQASETSQIQHVSIVDSKLKLSEPQSIDRVERDTHEIIAKEPRSGAASGATRDQGQSVESFDRHENKATGARSGTPSGATREQSKSIEIPDQPDNDKENRRRPSFSSMSQTTEEPNAKTSEDDDGSEVTPTILPNQDKSPPKQSVSAIRTRSEIVTEKRDEDADDVLSELSSSTDDALPEERIMLKLKVNKWTRCTECIRVHKSCLHNRAGHFDPARCADYLDKVKSRVKKWDTYWNRGLPEITAAAERYINANYEEESEPDDNSEGLDIWQDAAESMVPASPSSSKDPLGDIDTNTTHALRPPSRRLDGAYYSSAEKAKDSSVQAHPAIPTPAHTPSPAVGVAEVPTTQQTPSKTASQPVAKVAKPDLKKVLGMLRKRGVPFDSDDDSDEDMEDTRPSSTAQPFRWPPKASSLNLFEVAPALRPPADPATTTQDPAPAVPNLRAGLSKKQLWKNLQSIQCAERRAKFGNPHKILDRPAGQLPGVVVKTTIQEEAPLTEAQGLAFHVSAVEETEVKMPFERFLGMPEEPVVVRENTFRGRDGRLVEFDLAFRDGRKEKGLTAGGRRVGDGKITWPFARG